ncbi:MAG: DUF4380 domain-containing protein [Prevotella sp.]|nr:DUF4380 domain-containing protein [Prevotella sp.]
MKKSLGLLIGLMAMGSASAFAKTGGDKQIVQQSETRYCIQTGDVKMEIDAGGGKILSLKLKDSEMLSQLKWPESFGSTFWTSPQKEWNWPPVMEFDKKAYKAELTDDALIMTSEVNERLGFRIRKEFKANDDNHSIVVTYSIVNEGKETRRVAPWEITRVPNAGLIFFDAPLDGITPSGLMPFAEHDGAVWMQPDAAQENRKVNADGKGWLAYTNNGMLLVKKFQDLEEGQPAPDEAEIQVYINRGQTYIELESQGAYTELKPGESLQWSVSWYLLPCDDKQEPTAELLKKVIEL